MTQYLLSNISSKFSDIFLMNNVRGRLWICVVAGYVPKKESITFIIAGISLLPKNSPTVIHSGQRIGPRGADFYIVYNLPVLLMNLF